MKWQNYKRCLCSTDIAVKREDFQSKIETVEIACEGAMMIKSLWRWQVTGGLWLRGWLLLNWLFRFCWLLQKSGRSVWVSLLLSHGASSATARSFRLEKDRLTDNRPSETLLHISMLMPLVLDYSDYHWTTAYIPLAVWTVEVWHNQNSLLAPFEFTKRSQGTKIALLYDPIEIEETGAKYHT